MLDKCNCCAQSIPEKEGRYRTVIEEENILFCCSDCYGKDCGETKGEDCPFKDQVKYIGQFYLEI